VSVAPRFVGGFEKGIDYKGDLAAFENDLRGHAAIARAFGPYKISIHSGSDKFSIYPIIGRLCGDLLHVKNRRHQLSGSPARRLPRRHGALCRDLPLLPRSLPRGQGQLPHLRQRRPGGGDARQR
jgi:hypothetical protein